MKDKQASSPSNMSPTSFASSVGNATKAAMKGTTPGASSKGTSSGAVPSVPQSKYWKNKHPLSSERSSEAGMPVSPEQEEVDRYSQKEKTASLQHLVRIKETRMRKYASRHSNGRSKIQEIREALAKHSK
jgi:hypothetical protein